MIRLKATAQTCGCFCYLGFGGLRVRSRNSRSSLLDMRCQLLHGRLGIAGERLSHGFSSRSYRSLAWATACEPGVGGWLGHTGRGSSCSACRDRRRGPAERDACGPLHGGVAQGWLSEPFFTAVVLWGTCRKLLLDRIPNEGCGEENPPGSAASSICFLVASSRRIARCGIGRSHLGGE
jgi:hypothetical protein